MDGGIDWAGCCDTERAGLAEPFVVGGVRYATNGKVLVAAKTELPDTDAGELTLPRRESLEAFAVMSEYAFEDVDVDAVEGELSGVCEKCGGAGQVLCRICGGAPQHLCVCGDSHACEKCEGTGRATCALCEGKRSYEKVDEGIDVLGVKVKAKYLRVILGGKPRFCRSELKGLSCLRFRCAGGEQGIIMAVVPTNTIREEENGR